MTRPLREIMSAAALLATLTFTLAGCGSTTTTNKPGAATPRTGQPSTVADTPRPPADPQLQALLNRLDGLEQQNRQLQDQLRRRELDDIEERRAQLAAAEQARLAQANPPPARPRDSAGRDGQAPGKPRFPGPGRRDPA